MKSSTDQRSESVDGPDSVAPATRRRERFRRFRRVCLRCLAMGSAVLVVVAAALWITQPWWLPAFAGPVASRLIGTPVSMQSMRLTLSGRLRAIGVTLGDPANDQLPAVTIDRAEADVRWGLFQHRGPSLSDVTLSAPIVRIRPTGGASVPVSPAEAVGRVRRALRDVFDLPSVEVADGSLIFADSRDEPVLTITGGGTFNHREGKPGVYDLAIEQTSAGEPIRLEGWVDLGERTARLETRDILLTHWLESVRIAGGSETWREVVTAGRLDRAVVEYSPESGLRTNMQIHEARIVAPLRTERDAPSEPLIFDAVHGNVSLTERGVEARVSGLVGGLPTIASMTTDGLSLTAPFRLEMIGGPFFVDTTWPALALAPRDVRELIDDFSSPEAQIGARIRLSRAGHSESFDAGVAVSGEIDLTDGAVTFVDFLYPVSGIAGRVEFDESEIRLVGLTGLGPTGATLSAEGVVTPTPAGAELDLTITAPDAPIDDALLAALSNDEADIVRSLFDRDALDALLVSNAPLMMPADEPAFGEQWRADIRVRVRRFPDRTPAHEVTVDAEFPRADLLYAEFPYPLRAAGMRLRITRDFAEVLHAPLFGPTGARGALAGRVAWDSLGTRPELDIHFNEAPVDELLFAAIERAEGANGAAAATLRDLGAGGSVVGDGRITVDQSGDIIWKVRAALAGLTLSPDRADDAIANALAGTLRVDPVGWSIEDAVVRLDDADVRLAAGASFSDQRQVSFHAQTDSIDLRAPIGGFVGLFDADIAARMDDLRAKFAPEGTVRAMIDATTATGDDATYNLTIEPISETSFLIAGQRVRLNPTGGSVTADASGLIVQDLSFAPVEAAAGHAGEIRISGGLGGANPRIDIDAADLMFEGSVARAAIASMNTEILDAWLDADPAGRFDLHGAFIMNSGSDRLRLESGVLRPTSLAFTRAGRRVRFDRIGGEITLGPTGGAVDSLLLESDGLSVRVSGEWLAGVTPGVRLSLEAHGDRLGADIFAMLPAEARDILDDIEFYSQSGFALRDATLEVNWPGEDGDVGDGFRDGLLFTGSAEVRNATLDPGIPIESLDGSAVVRIERPPAVDETKFEMALHATSVRVAGVTFDGARGLIARSDADADRFDLHFEGDVHGGIAVVEGALAGADAGPGGYALDIRLAGIDLASLIEERTGENDGSAASGSLDASLTIAGTTGGGPRGVGEIRIQGGELLRLPLVVTILELGNVLPPLGERLDYANAIFTLDNDLATFDRLVAVSDSIALIGVGDVRLPDFELDLRFGVSGNRRLPIFTSLFDALRNEILTTRVRGTLADPEVSAEPLSGIRRLISRILGGS